MRKPLFLFSNSQWQRCFCCFSVAPRGLGSTLPPLSFRAKPRNLVETNSFFFPSAGRYCCLSIFPRELCSAVIFYAVAPRCFDKLNMTEKKVCHSERSRGISWKRIFSSSPRQRCYCYLSIAPRGLSEEKSSAALFLLPLGRALLLFKYFPSRVM